MSTATLPPPVRATIDDLMRFDGKAELINGRIVPEMSAGTRHARKAFHIAIALENHSKRTGRGTAFPVNATFHVPMLLPRRESFSPDAAWVDFTADDDDPGPEQGSPTFAVEVRSPGDYGPVAESALNMKRADYFEAGTKAVWDVDPKFKVLTLYLADGTSQTFHKGDTAHSEPAVPGWTMPVDEIFG